MPFCSGTRAIGGAADVGVGGSARRGGIDVGDGFLAGVEAFWDKSMTSWVEAIFVVQGGEGGGVN